MSWWTRVANVFRPERIDRELAEEMECHIEEAIAAGRDPEEARRAFGPALRKREESRDIKVSAWLDALRSDVVFGWRQLRKSKVTAGAAVVSLGLTIGACTSLFRLADAVLFRPLPMQDPERLYTLAYQYIDDSTGKPEEGDSFDYPSFRELRAAARREAELMAISYSSRIDLTYGSDQEMEKAFRQYCSGWMFSSLGLKPALGRLLTASDDVKPGAHPYAVLSYEYWTRRFGRAPKAVGRTFRAGSSVYEIVGVVQRGFTGTETGTMTDVFIPTMMNAQSINNRHWNWFRTWVRLKPGAAVEPLRQKLQAVVAAQRRENVKEWGASATPDRVKEYVNAPLRLRSAAAGASGTQEQLKLPLAVLAVVVALVLLIACANVANLMTAQAESRAREMALRVSIGAGRGRLAQLVLVESAMLALAASVLGGAFAWWSVPLVVSMMSQPDSPAQFVLPADWRVFTFAASLATMVTFLFGLAPALKASGVKPMSALRGGEDPRRRRRLMNALIAAQVAFCVVVHLAAGLFVTTYKHLSNQPTGFSSERVLTLETVSKTEQPPAYWDQVTNHLRTVNGIESAALCGWALMSGNGWTSDVRVAGVPLGRTSPYFLSVSPEWLATMRIPILNGRDFRPEDAFPQVAIVNEAFARRYFAGQDPVGRSFEQENGQHKIERTQIVGYVRDARYRDIREPVRPTVYVPFRSADEARSGLRSQDWGTFVVRTAGDPLALAAQLRREVPRARPGFLVSNIRTQRELVDQHTVRERLLGTLSLYFATLALVLAGVGLYGVLHFSFVQRRREIGIRMALGARAAHVARRLTADVFVMFIAGAACGLAAGIASERYLHTLLYEVKATDAWVLAAPVVATLGAALAAAIPPVLRAIRIDPAVTLRGE